MKQTPPIDSCCDNYSKTIATSWAELSQAQNGWLKFEIRMGYGSDIFEHIWRLCSAAYNTAVLQVTVLTLDSILS